MKQSKINQIVEEKVLKKIEEKFLEKNFKYKKGIRGFYKRENELLSEVTIDKDFRLFMTPEGEVERYNDLYITFKIFFRTELSEFEKWYQDNFGKGDHARIDTFSKTLEFCVLAKEGIDFKIPEDISPNQKEYFGEEKRLVKILPNNIYQFASWDMIDEIEYFDSHIDMVFSTLDKMIETKYDYLKLYANKDNSNSLKYNALLIYDNQFDLPTKFIINKCDNAILKIKNLPDGIEKEKFVQSLNRFISMAEKHLDLNISNPFE